MCFLIHIKKRKLVNYVTLVTVVVRIGYMSAMTLEMYSYPQFLKVKTPISTPLSNSTTHI